MGKITMWNAVLFVLTVVALVIFDLFLRIGELHGVVFSLYMLYASALFFLVNGLLAVIFWVSGKADSAKNWLVNAIGFTAVGAFLAYIGWLVGDV